MNVHYLKPYAIDKNLGRAYNEAMRMIPEGDWGCLMDYDTMFLTPDCGKIVHDYATEASIYYGNDYKPDPLMTCYTNRIGCEHQIWAGRYSEDSDIRTHIDIAEKRREDLYQVAKLNRVISGFLMLVSKSTWESIKFTEDKKCLGVDNDYSAKILSSGRDILRMEGLYVWHTYRLAKGIKDKSHLL